MAGDVQNQQCDPEFKTLSSTCPTPKPYQLTCKPGRPPGAPESPPCWLAEPAAAFMRLRALANFFSWISTCSRSTLVPCRGLSCAVQEACMRMGLTDAWTYNS